MDLLAAEPSTFDLWFQVQSTFGAGAVAQPAEFEFRLYVQPELGGRTFAMQSSKLNSWL